jgi:glycerophosphoryl diester phosphodiesterase
MGFVVETYTINDESEMRRLVEVGVDAIFTDRPDLLARVLNSRGPVRS